MIDSLAAARQKMEALAGSRSETGETLSIAISTSRLDDWRQSAPVYLNSEFNRVIKERDLPADSRRLLQEGFERALDLLKYEITPRTQGLAVFTDGREEATDRIELPLRLTNCLTIEPWPYIRPVAHALSLLEPFVLAEVSRDESSLYLVDEWGVAAEDDLSGPRLRSSDRESGEMSIKQYYAAARVDDLVDHHYKEVGASLTKLLEASGADDVLVCAQHDVATAFRRAVPSATAERIVAEMPLDAAATLGQRVASARKAMKQAWAGRMDALAARIKEGLGPNGRGVAGFDEVLGALHRGQVHTLLVDRAYQLPGWRCSACVWVGTAELESCPLCGSKVRPVMDLVGELIRLTILERGDIEVGEHVEGLAALGNVAGLLRYA